MGTASGKTRRTPFFLEGVPLVQQRVDTPDAGTDDDAQPLRLDLRRTRVGPGLPGSDQRVLAGRVQTANLDPGQDLRGGLLDGRRDLHLELEGLDPVERHQAHP